ncbi:hypothetical protein J27TS8_09440 [Robertmurraya siralis]|uniref:Sulfurtransferase n=1 Tax=Robertmurraya siralis TaxID=77777 RepID=A0A920BSS6_9BACI|nr:hypothetical protein [Robertmurraya siralis]PAE22631.1 hypothetical protein CHH80_01345 [Bacillus sp. 7504-2]GIN60951.1 hypothetical protein J27TS8_09440 [Robertmurraya siralis]
MTIFILIVCIVLVLNLYRYLPVWGVRCLQMLEIDENSTTIVDVRDYNQSYKDVTQAAINIPVAYLNRYFHEIPGKQIHVVAATSLEKNISIRFLRKKGYAVKSYTLTDCQCN